ncbi:MAG: type II toxin-antitoxin system HicA family toxin [Termitinemataceae bacterium]|nr:MAG: type II toxin-antitoxin system HicA family toxin [Termitinemataceae bacterium]
MTKKELERKLISAGWIITHGRAHDQATNPQKTGVKIPIPRHKGDIPKGTAKSILKDAGLA